MRPWFVVLVLLCAVACGRDEPRPREPQPLAPAPRAAPAPSAEPPPTPPPVEETRDPTPEELPLPEDFSAEAGKQITRKNLKAQLDAIEKELDAEK